MSTIFYLKKEPPKEHLSIYLSIFLPMSLYFYISIYIYIYTEINKKTLTLIINFYSVTSQ